MSSEKGLYIIYCKDDLSGEMVENGKRFGGSAKRIANYVEHRAYLASTNDPNSPNYILKIAVGPLESEDLKYMIGSCCIVEATREEAERFNQNDPLYKNGVWKEVSTTTLNFT